MSSDKEGWERTSESEQPYGRGFSIEETDGDSNSSDNNEELHYDISAEPIATPEEHAEYERVVLERQQLAL